MKSEHKHRGFTLVETLVYLSLYAIIMSGVLVAVYSIFESSARNQAQAMVQEEGSYLIGKIDWAISNVSSIQVPASGLPGGTQLSVTKYDGTAISIQQNGNNLEISENGAAYQTLNNTNTGVSGVNFLRTLATADGINPESIKAVITVTSTTTDGHSFSRNFSTVKYLRK